MAKKILTVMKVQAMGGAATPAPPLGPALSQHGVNIAQFVNDFNNATQDRRGEVVPAVLTIYEDRSYSFELKTAPTAELIKKAAGIFSNLTNLSRSNPFFFKSAKSTSANKTFLKAQPADGWFG